MRLPVSELFIYKRIRYLLYKFSQFVKTHQQHHCPLFCCLFSKEAASLQNSAFLINHFAGQVFLDL